MATTNSFQQPELDKIQVPLGSEIGLGVPVFGVGLPNDGMTEVVDPEQLIEANQNFNYAGFWDNNNNNFYKEITIIVFINVYYMKNVLKDR